MADPWFAVEMFPNLPKQVRCDQCDDMVKVWAVQGLGFSSEPLRYSVDCPKGGRRVMTAYGDDRPSACEASP